MSTILIIEDNQETARILELSLKREGYEIRIALDGHRGLELAQATPPDLILLDLMLPGIDGFEICSRLRANPVTASLPILILSAKAQEADKTLAAELGANSYLAKPYRRAELLAAVRSLLPDKTPPTSPAPSALS
jgi:DNA-binding response OmpR family regulator